MLSLLVGPLDQAIHISRYGVAGLWYVDCLFVDEDELLVLVVPMEVLEELEGQLLLGILLWLAFQFHLHICRIH